METTTVLRAIQSEAENIQSDLPQRFPEAAAPGDYFRQGDLYIWKRKSLPRGTPSKERQLAPGTTKGSRHVLDSLEGVTVVVSGGNALQGPWLDVREERTVTHPEHGNVILPPGVYEITYQRAYAGELRRVLD